MQYKVTLAPSGVHYSSEDNLLDDALAKNLMLEHSCKNGDCGVCEASVLSGQVLDQNGCVVTAGTILTCQSKPLSDVTLEAEFFPELAEIKQQTLPCKVSSISYPTKDIAVLKLRFPPTAKFEFIAGQYLDLMYKGIKRSYSIASSMSTSHEVELHIRNVPQGKMSEHIFSGIKDNQLMRIEGPKGTFFTRSSDRKLVFLATGTGIAPVKAMIERLVESGDTRKVMVYWGMRTPSELYCKDLENLIDKLSDALFIPVLSQSADWKGRKGYVQNAAIEDIKDLDNCDVYACGSVAMIESARELFSKHNLSKQHFYSDAFTPAK
ncbi:CDP-6-deoxy-delta-3,4-glucoseen reductase [Vibrio zhanjiangensis]|uniref:CDP-6-deoxy-delta-3,4-glucoseen reductase n=1 Tax=Vibrio zhanjiangensis TaxID=1046128 RepID=A0ABQ6F744_9VIBR|nr:FAD-binding oxidoreductase [Vibrio zhanjiangensis]GLT20420.1 CDP-6-deoxy-delta-3,4-glucoseen reductase [Vibrio zhanjiangensis]